MKIKRSKLKKIISEFVSAIKIAEGKKLDFPMHRIRKTRLNNQDSEKIGQLRKLRPHDIDYDAEGDGYGADLTDDELRLLQKVLNDRSAIRRSTRAADDTLDSLDPDFEEYLQGLESGEDNLVDIFGDPSDDYYDDEEY